MNTDKTLKVETTFGSLEFTGTPVSNDFNYNAFALENGFEYIRTNSPENTDKYGGVGFVTFRNHSETSDISYHLKKELEILFINGLPVIYKIK